MGHVSLPGTSTTGAANSSIDTLNPIYPNMIVTCTQTGGQFTKDQTYKRNSDNTAWVSLAGGIHLHDDSTEAAGGLYTDMLKANQSKAYFYHNLSPVAGDFRTEGSVTADYSSSAGVLKLPTGTQSGNYIHLSRSGVRLSFSHVSQFMFKGNLTYDSQANQGYVTCYMGVGVARVDSTTSQPQYGLQVCDSAGIERNWEIVNGNGTTKAIETTAELARSSSAKAYKLRYTPGAGTQFWVDGVLKDTNTQAVLASGSSQPLRVISLGVKTNIGAERTLYVYGVSLTGVVNDLQWV